MCGQLVYPSGWWAGIPGRAAANAVLTGRGCGG